MNVMLSPHSRKKDQCVMNHHQSTFILGKDYPETECGPDLAHAQNFGPCGATTETDRSHRGLSGSNLLSKIT